MMSHLWSQLSHGFPAGKNPRKRRAGDVETFQPPIIQSIVNTAAQIEPIANQFRSPAIGNVSSGDPQIRPAQKLRFG